ncbi:DnaJ domain-containing protein [Vibrio sp. WXL210]|uniref:DnaJ domain-containing protein n=1 Tax=Vibrio sp. WXL210 TaxID=3450709 RepID=UPI003EC8D1B8
MNLLKTLSITKAAWNLATIGAEIWGGKKADYFAESMRIAWAVAKETHAEFVSYGLEDNAELMDQSFSTNMGMVELEAWDEHSAHMDREAEKRKQQERESFYDWTRQHREDAERAKQQAYDEMARLDAANDDLFSSLGLEPTATKREVKRAYRKLANIHHPDKGGDAEKFKALKQIHDMCLKLAA